MASGTFKIEIVAARGVPEKCIKNDSRLHCEVEVETQKFMTSTAPAANAEWRDAHTFDLFGSPSANCKVRLFSENPEPHKLGTASLTVAAYSGSEKLVWFPVIPNKLAPSHRCELQLKLLYVALGPPKTFVAHPTPSTPTSKSKDRSTLEAQLEVAQLSLEPVKHRLATVEGEVETLKTLLQAEKKARSEDSDQAFTLQEKLLEQLDHADEAAREQEAEREKLKEALLEATTEKEKAEQRLEEAEQRLRAEIEEEMEGLRRQLELIQSEKKQVEQQYAEAEEDLQSLRDISIYHSSTTAPDLPPDGSILKAGTLVKQGHMAKNWKKRHFVLYRGPILCYYDDVSTFRTKPHHPLGVVNVVSSVVINQGDQIIISTPGSDEYTLRASTSQETDEWMEVLSPQQPQPRKSLRHSEPDSDLPPVVSL